MGGVDLKGKLFVIIISMALLVGFLSGCVEEEPEPKKNTPPTATFTSDVTHNVTAAGGTVAFDCTATDADGDNLTYTWDFGDGETSDQEDPEHIYAANGSYIVTVTVNDGTDSFTTDPDIVLVGNQAPVAGFTYLTDNLTVTFIDISTDDGTISSWSWDFGDGNTSTDQNPEWTYEADGTYTIILTVMDEYDLTSEAYSEDVTVAQET